MQQNRLEIPLSDGIVGFAVAPKEDCPHYNVENQKKGMQNCIKNGKELFKKPCNDCGDFSENWICLSCSIICCSREINGHMLQHNKQTQHPIVLSLSDISFWCYECESYITNFILELFMHQLSTIKFKPTQQQGLNVEVQTLQVNKTLDYQEFISGLKSKKYQNIFVLASHEINKAVINFRSNALEEYHLQNAHILFEIDYFKINPNPFYTVANKYYKYNPKPNSAHHLLKQIDLRNQLAMCITQNTDGKELEVGVTPEKVIQAYGTSKSAHCLQCKNEASINDFIEQLKIYKVQKCNKCQIGLIKPDLVFEGERPPETYYQNIENLKQADLVLIIGSYLKQKRFTRCEELIPQNTPIVQLNLNGGSIKRNNVLHINGPINENCQKILEDLN